MGNANQKLADEFYKNNGNCCSGCDHWRFLNGAKVGECVKSNIMSLEDAYAGIGITSHSGSAGTSHALTKRYYVCGNFEDTFDWSKE